MDLQTSMVLSLLTQLQLLLILHVAMLIFLPTSALTTSTSQPCRLAKNNPEAYSLDGDIIFGGLVPLNGESGYASTNFEGPPSPRRCETFLTEKYQNALAMVFATEEINRNGELLANKTLGFKLVDSCYVEAIAIGATLGLLSGPLQMVPNYHCNEGPRLAAILGDSPSAGSIPMARILGLSRFPQISYGSGLPLLRDKVQFPSFVRTITSVDHQPYGVVELLLHFGWTWVGILASDNDYGQEGSHALQNEMAKNGVCVEYVYTVGPHTPKDQIIAISKKIQKSTSQVIVLYTFIAEAATVLEEVTTARIPQKVWIAVSSWLPSPVFAKTLLWKTLNGTLGLAIGSGQIPGFRDFLSNIHPSKYPTDIFIKDFWEEAFQCTWTGNRSAKNPRDKTPNDTPSCTATEQLSKLDSSVYDVDNFRFAYAAYNAVHVVAQAMQNLLSCKPGQGPFANGSCASLQNYRPWQFLHYVKTVNYNNTAGERIYFDANGDSPGFFDILNWQLSTDGRSSFVKVGTFATQSAGYQNLIINDSAIFWGNEFTQAPRSVCSESCGAGQRMLIREGEPPCCYNCVLCPEGEVSNHTDATDCMKCPDDQWPNESRDLCMPKTEEYLSFSEPLGAILSSVSTFGFLLASSVLCIFIKHRDTPIIKANNKTLSYVLLVSILLCFACSLLFIGRPGMVHCWLRQGLFSTLFSFAVSCVLAKTITVVIAFRATKPNSSLRKWVGSAIPNSLILTCSITQVVIYGIWLVNYPPFPDRNNQAFRGRMLLECNEGSPSFHYGMKIFLGLLALVTLVVAFLARKLPGGFNEAQHITFSMLVFTSVWISFIPAYLSTTGKYTVAVEVFAILSSSAGLLSCIFAPKCYIIIMRPKMNTREHLMGTYLLKN